jgi:CRISPR-associated protein Cmr5
MSAKSLQRTLEQERAQQAWACVQEVTNKPQEFKKKYGSLARKVPMLVLTNGLGQTLAFLKAKGKNDPADEHTVLFRHLSSWVLSQVASSTPASNGDLLQWVLQNDSAAYRRATTEALAFLAWLKRFAEAELPTED